ncbi:MAG: ATP synthase F1 subunit gamma [Myxococcales bacterium]|nr:ATP synthase F1 subunit gamma [Myxococcales bacterium]
MKMVAASKLRRAQNAILQARPYAERMQSVLEHIVNRADLGAHPLLQTRVPKRVELVILTSDRGLCGSFNSNIIRTSERWIAENRAAHEAIFVSTIGRKGRDHFLRRGFDLEAHYDDVLQKLDYPRAAGVATDLALRFRRGKVDAVYLLYNEFKSAISQSVTLVQLLPLKPLTDWKTNRVAIGELASVSRDTRAVAGQDTGAIPHVAEDGEESWPSSELLARDDVGFEHIFEPSREGVLEELLPQHLAVQVWRALLESSAAEHGARMSAMDSASRNASDLIDSLSLEANRVRQASITTELMEIVSGAESLAAS